MLKLPIDFILYGRNNGGLLFRQLLSALLIASLVAFSCASTTALLNHTGATSDRDPGDSPAPANPLLKHRRQATRAQEQREICHVWTRHSPHDLCARGRWARDNVQLGELFKLDWRALKSEADLLEQTDHLRAGDGGRGCLLGAANSDESAAASRVVERAYDSFARVLHRFDCGLALDSASATRPFSPNGTCHDCKHWYRKWLLVQLLPVWRDPPCINWCFYAQLACPHLATIRVVDFGGHPAFLCRDLDIPQRPTERTARPDGAASCSCIHPCDLSRSADIQRLKDGRDQRAVEAGAFDFFAAEEHCSKRSKRCDEHKRRTALFSDGHES
ncbi:Two pore potassium channel protein sup-9 [Aphelenchoides fujianensis]|nr:Two pore potassium channel protein sup-9 [Aphelenchoides fujianensis]